MTTGRKILIIALLLLPVLLVAVFSILQTRKQLIADIYKERSTQASLSTDLLKAKLDHLTDIGKAFASRPVFRQYIAEKKWDKAIELMQEVPAGFSYITMVMLADSNGQVMASTQPGMNTLPWLSEIGDLRRAHITGVFKNRQQQLVSSLTTPVFNQHGALTGLMALEVNVGALLDWSTGVSIGTSGFIYIVDQKGHLAASPVMDELDSVIDYSSVPAVKEALQGNKNTAVLYNPIAREYRLSAFEQVPGYGWAVIVQEEASSALSVTKKLWPVFIFFSLVILMAAGFAAFIIREIIRRNKTAADLRTYTDLVENTRVVIRNMKNEIIFWNRGMENLYGWKKEEAIGKISHQLFASIFPQPLPAIDDTLLSSNQWQGEIKHCRKDGSVIHVASHWSLIRDKKGHPFAVIETNNDITELKKAEEKVEALSIQIDQSNDAIYTVDAQRLIKSWNRGAEKLYGYSLEEAVGKDSNRLLQTVLSESAIDLAVSQLSKEDYWSGELKRKTKQGNTVDVYSSTTTIRAADGTITGYVAVSIDITEQVKLREQVSYLAALVDQSADAIASVSMEIKILSWNRGAETLLGYNSSEALGKTPRQLGIIDLSRQRQDEIFYGILANGYWQFEMNFYRKDGSNFFGAINASPVKNKHGVINGVVFIIKDISERKRLEEQLTEYNAELEEKVRSRTHDIYKSEKRFRALLENNYDVINLLDASFKIFYRSPSASRATGWSDEEMANNDGVTNIHPDDKPAALEVMRDIMTHPGKPVYALYRILHKKGHYIWLEGVIVNWLQDEAVNAIVINCRDVTERIEAEQQLSFSEKRFRTLIEYNYDSIILIDASYKTVYRSPAATRMTGWLNDELAGTNALKNIHPADIAKLNNAISEVLANPGKPVNTLFRNLHKQGNYIWVEGTITNWLNDESIKAVVLNSRDVTERIQAEEKLAVSEKRFRTLIENNYDIISLMDASFNIIYRSPSAVRITGWTDEDMKGQSGTKNIHPDDQAMARSVVKNLLENPGKALPVSFRNQHKNGHYLWVEGTIINLLRDEAVQAIVFNFRDVTERVNAEEKLAASEIRFRSLIENSAEGVSLLDADANVVYRSPGGSKITGTSPVKNALIYAHPDDYDYFKKKFNDALTKPGIPVPYEVRFANAAGDYYWAEGSFTNLLKVNGVNAIVANYRDITKRKDLENLLHKANTLARIGGWEVDLLKSTVYWTDITKEIHETGYDYIPDLEAGLNFYKEGEGRNLIKQKVKEAIEDGRPWDVELPIITARNNERWIRSIGETEFANGKCIRIYGSFQDIHLRKETEARLIESEKLYRSLFENMTNGFAYCRAIFKDGQLVDYTYLSVNNSYEKLTGLADVTGKNMSEVMPALLQPDLEYLGIVTRVVLSGKPEKFETYVQPLDKWFSISLYSPGKEYFISLVDNITERKLVEQKIRQVNAELEDKVARRTEELIKINEELEAFSYSVSHDLRAPLRGIIGFTAILEEDYTSKLDAEAKRITGVIKHNTLKMGNLIDDLLLFSRMGRQHIEKSTIDNNEMAGYIIEELEQKAAGGTIQWVIHPLHPVNGDIPAMRQVWFNLIANAVKYSGTRQHPRIEIKSFVQGNQLVFMIKDNGVGFDQKYSSKLFKVFQRLHAADEFEGTGVGLAIVEKIISKHGGRVWAEGVLNEGAAFYFSLPAG